MFVSVALLILIQSAAVVPVTVTSRSPQVEVHEFSDAELSCEFRTEKDKNPRIEWKKIDKDVSFVFYDGRFVGPFNERAEIEGATVRLRRVTQLDAGKYRCEVSAPQDSITLGETNVTLKVLVPPQTPSCDVPSSALTGSQVELRCKDQHSIPPAVYTWFKNNHPLPIRQPNATYTIDEFSGVLVNDLNVAAVIAGVVLLCLLVLLCAFGVFYAHRHGYFSRHRGRSFWIPQCHGAAHISSQNLHRTEHAQHSGYSHPPKEDFKHTQSFML
ncbi:junctional adhesion molecule 2A-like [Garra rufa]|uniref:junctional adhesion molecule 2A-like n=1 Tax=Garra rufa TaxID=137080 RepID=UPI003CCE7003